MNIFLFIFGFMLLESQAQVLKNSVFSPIEKDAYDPDMVCPKMWVFYGTSCYRFFRSPIKTRNEARQYCRQYNSDLASLNSMEENSFLTTYLQSNDPSHRIWYISGRQVNPGNWKNDGDGTTMINLDSAFLPNQDTSADANFLAYGYSLSARQWGLLRVDGLDPMLYICEILASQVLFQFNIIFSPKLKYILPP